MVCVICLSVVYVCVVCLTVVCMCGMSECGMYVWCVYVCMCGMSECGTSMWCVYVCMCDVEVKDNLQEAALTLNHVGCWV